MYKQRRGFVAKMVSVLLMVPKYMHRYLHDNYIARRYLLKVIQANYKMVWLSYYS